MHTYLIYGWSCIHYTTFYLVILFLLVKKKYVELVKGRGVG